MGLESDGDFHYNPSTGTLTATNFIGTLSGSVTTATNIIAAANSENENQPIAFLDNAGKYSRFWEVARVLREGEPDVIDQTVEKFLAGDCDYVSNTLTRTYPIGIRAQVFRLDLLRECEELSSTQQDREHVTTFICRNESNRYTLKNLLKLLVKGSLRRI